jgi:glycerate 2-kinase
MTPAGPPERAVLVAPARFGDGLRAPAAAAAIGRGLEAAGLVPPDLCPLAGGGVGTIEALLPALGGETADGFALVEDGGTAIVDAPEHLDGAAAAGAAVVVLAAADGPPPDLRGLDLGGARLVVLAGPGGGPPDADALPRGASIEPGARFVLEALGADARLRAARAVIVGGVRLDESWLEGAVAGELAVRARQAGVPCHAIVAENVLDRFGARMLDLQRVLVAATPPEIEAAAASLVDVL